MIFGRKRESREPQVGHGVMTVDEEEFGVVTAVHADRLEVEGGPMDHRVIWQVPRSAVSRVEEDSVYLNVSRGQALAKGWEHHAQSSGQGIASTNA